MTVPRTFPSFVTLLTGRYPHHHGIRHMFPSAIERDHVGTTLPATLATAGYRTAALSDYAGEIFARTPLGFDEVDAPRFDMHTIVALRGLQLHPSALPYAAGVAEALFPYVRALSDRADPQLLADRAVDRLDHLTQGLGSRTQPFFETVFFSTPHFPYAAPYPYYARYGDPLYEGAFLYEKPPLSPATVGPADAAQIQALYDGAVAAVDDQIARLLRALHDSGAEDNTIVVLLADHGENLWEDPRAGMGHGDHLIGERAVNVPLLIYDPRNGSRAIVPRDIDAIVRDVDLTPTLSALCGVTAPPTDGVDLSSLLYGSTSDLAAAGVLRDRILVRTDGPRLRARRAHALSRGHGRDRSRRRRRRIHAAGDRAAGDRRQASRASPRPLEARVSPDARRRVAAALRRGRRSRRAQRSRRSIPRALLDDARSPLRVDARRSDARAPRRLRGAAMKRWLVFFLLSACSHAPRELPHREDAPAGPTLPLRLVDHAGDAIVDGDVTTAFRALTHPLLSPSPLADASAFPRVLQVTFAEPDLTRLLPTAEKNAAKAKIDFTWNRTRGIYEAREALFVPPAVRYHYAIPAGDAARFTAEIALPPDGKIASLNIAVDGHALPPVLTSAADRGRWRAIDVQLPARAKQATLTIATDGGALFLGAPIVRAARAIDRRPNVVFVLVDTLRVDALAAMPHLSQYATKGARFLAGDHRCDLDATVARRCVRRRSLDAPRSLGRGHDPERARAPSLSRVATAALAAAPR